MYISNPSGYHGSTYKKDEQDQHGSPLRHPDSNANFMQGSQPPSMGSVSSQNQTTAENVQFATTLADRGKDGRQEAGQDVGGEKTSQTDEDDRVQRIWPQDLRRTYDRPPTERVLDGPLSPHVSVSNGRHPGSRGMSPVEGNPQRSYSSSSPALLYGTTAPHHSVLQYTSPPMVQYSTVPGFQTYAPYYPPFVRLPGHPTVMRPAPHEMESSYSEMLASIGSQVRAGQPLLPHSLLPTTVHTPFAAIDSSPLPSPREYPAPGFAIPGGGIYVVGVQPESRSGSRHPSGDQRAEKDTELTHPHPARERWECHERNAQEHPHEEARGSRGPSQRDLHPVGHHVRFKEPVYQTEVGHERAYQESPKIAHVHPLEPTPREERFTHPLPSANIHPLYANALTIQTSLQSPPQLVSPPATYTSMQLQLSPTPQVRSSTHAASSQKAQHDAVEDVFNPSRSRDSPKAVARKEPATGAAHLYSQPSTHKQLSADTEYRGPSTFPSYFTRGSVIQLASGELKRVEDLCTDDFIQSAAVTDGLKIDSSTVVRIEDVAKKPAAIIGFSVGDQREQVTVEAGLEHPFYVFGHGWSSVKPELTLHRYNLGCHKLAVGDVCVSLTPKEKVPIRRDEQSDAVQRTYRSEYLDNKRQRVKYRKNPSDHVEHHKETFIASEQRHHTNVESPREQWYHPPEQWYHPPGVDKHNKLASELKSLNVSSSGAGRNSTQGLSNVRPSNASRSDVKSGGVKGKHTYHGLEEVKEEEEEVAELVTKQKKSHRNTIHEPVQPVSKYTIAR